jgi:hypothetical protein
MTKKVGLWIDHKEAILIFVSPDGEEKEIIISNVEKQLSREGDEPHNTPYEAQKVPSSDRLQNKFTHQLNIYYDNVIKHIGNAKSVLIFGPGEAKNELKESFKRKKLDNHIIEIETVDKMTINQITTKVRNYFIK